MNPITTKDLRKNLQGVITDLEGVSLTYKEMIDQIVADAERLEKAMKKVNGTTGKGRKKIDESARQAEELARRQAQYQESLKATGVELAKLRNLQRRQNQINKLQAKEAEALEGSYDKLSAQYALNKIRLNAMSEAQRKATKEGQDLEKQSAEIFEEMKRLQEATGKHVLSVGDYEKGSRKLIETLQSMPGSLGSASSGVQGLGQQFKLLLRNPIVAFVAAIASGLALLFTAFQRSEKGADLLAKGTGLLNGLMSQLVNAAVAVYDAVVFAFTEPVEAVKALGSTIVNQVLNRLKAVPLIAQASLNALKALWSRDMTALKEAGEDAFFAVNQAITGLDEQQSKNLAKAISETTKEVIEQTNAFIDLETQKRAVRRSNRDLAKSIEELTTAEAVQNSIADDTTKSFKEREEAAEAARQALERRSKLEVELARNNLNLINQEISLRKQSGEDVEVLLDQQLEGYRALRQAEREFTLSVRDNERTRSELKQDRLERDLDILIDGFDNQKSVNERLLQDEALTAQERIRILQETSDLADESFLKQIQTIQQFTGVQVDSNDLINESNAVVLNEKIRSLGLSEIIEGRLLEIIRDRKTANQDLAEAEIELAKRLRSERLKELELTQQIALQDFENTKRTEVEKTQFLIDQKTEQLQTIRELNEQAGDNVPSIDTRKIEADLRKLNASLQQARKNSSLEAFGIQQEFAQSEFDLLESTEREKTDFRLQAEKDRLEKILELNEQFGSDLTDVQVKTIQNQIAAIDNEIQKNNNNITDIYDLFGLNLGDEEKEAVATATQFAIGQITELFNTRSEIADRNAQIAANEVSQAQQNLQTQLQLEAQGGAARTEQARLQLDQAKRNQREALEEQKKAQREQLAIESVQQASSLVTASAKIIAQLPFPAWIPAIALMWGTFAAAKARAFSATSDQFGDGMFEHINVNGSHASGNDTDFGVNTRTGRRRTVERNEVITVFPARTVRKYGVSTLKNIYESLKAGTFDAVQNNMSSTSNERPVYVTNDSRPTDMTTANRELRTIRRQNETRTGIDKSGNYFESYRGHTTIYISRSQDAF